MARKVEWLSSIWVTWVSPLGSRGPVDCFAATGQTKMVRFGVMISYEDLDNWFTYHPPTEEQRECYERLRDAAKQFAEVIVDNTPTGKDQDAAVLLVRQAVMMANAAVACRWGV